MKSPSVHILWKFNDGPWGGGNQFLKALRKELIEQGYYTETPEQADIILFNSHQHQKQLLQLKKRYPDKIFVHRVDGPLSHTRGKSGITTDRKIFYCNEIVADGTIFQSQWSREESYRCGIKEQPFEACIINAPDPGIFHPTRKYASHDRIRLITTSWSANPRKGFDVFHYLDHHLDFRRYSMMFVGNTEQAFKNIKTIAPQPSAQLADLLRSHDIFIAASKGEPCSNSFLEALHCGLPAVARNDASYPELLGDSGLLFEGTADVIDKINTLAENIDNYRNKIRVHNINEITEAYLTFFRQIKNCAIQKAFTPKRLSILKYYLIRVRLKTM